ncbi:uncharacterized protein LOC115956972 [Quercus lobata]|uniref:S-adenosyl-L-methionine-dependent methyltransferase n=1 Tax=Quercus lobata TaxID=97700 RepID=A0A7N2MD70_QUELO|nr:uncharacterized protein LOC115956972 [Quercus lobata]
MKEREEDQIPHHRQRRVSHVVLKLAKPITYFLLLLLTYTLGYLSASSIGNATSLPTTRTRLRPTRRIKDLKLDDFRVSNHCSNPVPSDLVRQTILNRIYNARSPFVDFPPDHVSSLVRPQRIGGWGSNGAVFEHLIERVKPKTIIEIGTFLGASAIHMARLTRQLGLETQILCVDDFRGWPGFRNKFKNIKMVNGDVVLMYQFMQNLVSVNETDSVLPIPFSTGSTLDKFCEWGVYADLIEVDAGHNFMSAWSDINRAYRLLRPGGVLFGHDYFTAADNRGVRRAVRLFARVNGFKIILDGQHWIIDST